MHSSHISVNYGVVPVWLTPAWTGNRSSLGVLSLPTTVPAIVIIPQFWFGFLPQMAKKAAQPIQICPVLTDADDP